MGKRHGVVVGYDLGREYAQISYYLPKGEDAETLAVVAGTEQYNIPMVLYKKKNINQWLFGKDAVQKSEENGTELVEPEGYRVERLVELACKGETVKLGEEEYDPVALLTLFIRRSLALLGIITPLESIGGVMFTAESLDERMIKVLLQVAANLHLKTDRIYFQSYRESFCEYMLQQAEELWKYEALLCDYDNRRLRMYTFVCNRRTIPKVLFVDCKEHEEMKRQPGRMGELPQTGLDETFLELMKAHCNGRAISSVYLIGDGYKDNWASDSLRYLCQGRRVFQGNNLYSKGACYGIKRRMGTEEEQKEYVFLGEDKLSANVGMRLLRRGEESYFAIMDAGTNWYEAKKEFDLLLEAGDTISVLLTPLKGGAPQDIHMTLDGLPVREAWTTRLRVKVQMLSKSQLYIRVRDMGFGEFVPSSGGEWVQQFELQ